MDVTAGLEATRFIGERVPRREDARLLTGRGRYVDDVVLPGMLHAAFVRSPHASAVITAIDTEAAAALDGVRAVLTFDDIAAVGTVDGSVPRRPLARGSVCFVGDPVVVVVAESRARAEDACELVDVHYDATAALVEPRAAIADASRRVHEEIESNIVAVGASADDPELDDLFVSAPYVVSETISQHRYLAVPMETRGIVANWDPVQRAMAIWISTQGAHMARDHFAGVLGLDPPSVHVIVGDVGGAFGQKINVGREETALALAARVVARPVKWIEDRWENLVAAPHAR